jgi:RNA-dependent RNA polymerase
VPDGVHIIAHCELVQRKMDQLSICWGVQYELARGETRGWWKWSDVSLEKLKELQGTNRLSAGKVFSVMKGTSVIQKEFKVWYVLFFYFPYGVGSLK